MKHNGSNLGLISSTHDKNTLLPSYTVVNTLVINCRHAFHHGCRPARHHHYWSSDYHKTRVNLEGG